MPRDDSTRRAPRVLFVVALGLLGLRVATGLYERSHPPELPDLVHWQAPAPPEDNDTGKPLLYDFAAEWCEPCALMKREVFGDEKIAGDINRSFVPMRVIDRQREDGRNPPVVEKLQERYQAEGLPTLVAVVPGKSEPLVLRGYAGKEQTRQFLERAIKLHRGLRVKASFEVGND